MGLFDDLLQDTGATPPWGRIAATFLNGLQTAQAGGGKVIDQLLQWGSLLARNAPARWGEQALKPVFCAVSGCQAQALVPCAACGKSCCLAHVLVSYHAEGICEPCALEFVTMKRKRASDADLIVEAFKTLRVSKSADWDEVRAAYRTLAAKHHPDKQKTAAARAKAEKRMKEINAAYAVLKLHMQEAA